MQTIIIATVKSWNIENAKNFEEANKDKYSFNIVTSKEKLTLELIKKLNPKYIFFPHWSWIIPGEIFNNYNCVIFHITDLPYGRGGSPLQNLIKNGKYHTKISALKASANLDSGDIYLKEDFFVGLGSAEEILMMASKIIFNKMIPQILESNIVPVKQTGTPVTFKRRTTNESNMLKEKFINLHEIYDFIRMLDGEGYPSAFISLREFTINFFNVHFSNNKLKGDFEISKKEASEK